MSQTELSSGLMSEKESRSRWQGLRRSSLYDHAINGLTVLVAAAALIAVARQYIPVFGTPPPSAGLDPGAVVKMQGVDWKNNQNTLVVALQVGCKFCEASAEFYQRLVAAQKTNSNFRIIAAMSSNPEGAKAYFAAKAIPITDVRQVDFADLLIKGTPTVLLVDGAGRLISRWTGKLSRDQEQAVFKTLKVDPPIQAASKDVTTQFTISRGDRVALRRAKQVIDIRTRGEFAAGHLPNAVNIPIQELEARARAEWLKGGDSADVLLYCDDPPVVDGCVMKLKSQGVTSRCEGAESFLRTLGVKSFTPLRVSIGTLALSGVPVITSPLQPFAPAFHFETSPVVP